MKSLQKDADDFKGAQWCCTYSIVAVSSTGSIGSHLKSCSCPPCKVGHEEHERATDHVEEWRLQPHDAKADERP